MGVINKPFLRFYLLSIIPFEKVKPKKPIKESMKNDS